jgi:hypothetical protein
MPPIGIKNNDAGPFDETLPLRSQWQRSEGYDPFVGKRSLD